jgi:glutathione synthase/RimK-type ligase-like ATP-grasp enzyme
MSIVGFTGRLNGLPGGDISTLDVHAVWYRRPTTRTTDFSFLSTSGTYVENESDAALRAFYNCLSHAFWVDKPVLNIVASEKSQQLRHATKVGLRVPETIITSDPLLVEEMAERHGGRVIAKPMRRGGVVIQGEEKGFFSTLLDLRMIREHAASIRNCPLIFQEPIPKAFELRATVVENQCFTVRLNSQDVPGAEVDWRQAPYKVHHEVFQLPETVAQKCVQMTRESGLHFSAFDLIVTPEGKYVFLEHNPNGQFAWLEELTGIPIGGALLDLFAQAME